MSKLPAITAQRLIKALRKLVLKLSERRGVIISFAILTGGEKRWAGFGHTDDGRLLVVVFTKRGNLIRIISARDMNRKERKFYEENG